MPTLNPLTPEMKEALGQRLEPQYEALFQKSKHESLRDNQDAVKYVDSVVKRYKAIEATSSSQSKREPFLAQLKQHVAEVAVVSFSKPEDVASRLKEVGFSSDSIDKITKGMEQAGVNDDDLATLITSVVTSETSLLSGGNTHGHPYGHHHHHSHW